MKILITGGKSSTALKLLKAFTAYQVILADYDEVPAFFSKEYRFISLGAKNEDTLAHTTLNHCLNEEVDLILPLQKFEIEPIAKSKVLFNEFDISVLLPNAENLMQFENVEKAEQWVVFMDGDPIFITEDNEHIREIGRINHMNGAYYFQKGSKSLLSLITL